MSCPPDEVLARYLEDGLFLEQRERVEEHVASCDHCATVLANAVNFLGGEATDPVPFRYMGALQATWRQLWCRLRREIRWARRRRSRIDGNRRPERREISEARQSIRAAVTEQFPVLSRGASLQREIGEVEAR